MRFVVVVSCLMACSNTGISLRRGPCVSHCGMLLEQPNKAINCVTLDTAESVSLRAIDKALCHKDPRLCLPRSCSALFGWQIRTHESALFDGSVTYKTDAGTREEPSDLRGQTYCGSKVMFVNDSYEGWRPTSFTHEIVHALQNCKGGGNAVIADEDVGVGHEGWTEKGIFQFLKDHKKGN